MRAAARAAIGCARTACGARRVWGRCAPGGCGGATSNWMSEIAVAAKPRSSGGAATAGRTLTDASSADSMNTQQARKILTSTGSRDARVLSRRLSGLRDSRRRADWAKPKRNRVDGVESVGRLRRPTRSGLRPSRPSAA
jgi:hypothetical protein